jgi:hypothetical protein
MTKFSFVLWIALSSVFLFQQVGNLDLTSAASQARKFEPVSGSSGGTGIGSGVPDSSYTSKEPLELTLTNVHVRNDGDYERVEYEIELKNVSTTVVRVPWDPSPRDIEPSPPRPYKYQLASLRLEDPEGSAETQRFEAISLYGSEESQTLQTLRPGEWVSIRAISKLKTLNQNFGEKKTSMLRATWTQFRVSVDGSPSEFHETLTPYGTQIRSQSTPSPEK